MSLEIVIPAHNEQRRIGPTLTTYRSGLLSHQLQLTVTLDDCMDATAEIVAQHPVHDPRVRVGTRVSLNVANFRKTIDEQRYSEEIAGRSVGSTSSLIPAATGMGHRLWGNGATQLIGLLDQCRALRRKDLSTLTFGSSHRASRMAPADLASRMRRYFGRNMPVI